MFTIYAVFGSPFARSLRIALDEKRVPWQWVDIGFGNAKSEPYLSRQPFGRVPAVEHDGFALYETQAILRYIERLASSPSLVPADVRAEARMNQLMGIADWYFFPQVTVPISFARLVAPRFGLPVDEARAAAGVPCAHTCLRAISDIAGNGRFLVGDQFTLADILLLTHVDPFAITPEGQALLPDYPRVASWLQLVRERPSVIASRKPPGQ